MKNFYLIFLLVSLAGYAQIKNGIIEYKVTSYMSNPIAGINAADMKKLTYTLRFNETASLFSVNDFSGIIEPETFNNLLISSNCNETYFKEHKSPVYFMQTNIDDFGVAIVEYPTVQAWELTTESKIIADYKCYKAICYKNDFGPPQKPRTLKIEAWYCPQLPISIGPKGLFGLPGLILEVEEPTRNIIFSASAVKLNTKENVVITKMTKGKLISEIEYRKIIQDWIDSNYK